MIYPTQVLKVRFCEGVIRYLLPSEMVGINIRYTILDRIDVENENTSLRINNEGWTTGALSDFIQVRQTNPEAAVESRPDYSDPAPGLDPVTGEPDNASQVEVQSSLSFYLFDHLGNTRVTFRADAPDAISITYAADYYPYGKILREYKACNQNRYLSTHHERDKDTGYDNRGARLYDSEIGRFTGVDPLASEMPEWSPYNYTFGNPVSLVDPNGAAPTPPTRVSMRSYRTVTFNGNGSHTISRSTHTRTFSSGSGQNRMYTERVEISEVTFKALAIQVGGGFSGPSSHTSAVTNSVYTTSGFSGGMNENGLVTEGYTINSAIESSFSSPNEESFSNIESPENAQLLKDVQGLANFLSGGGDGNGLAGTPLTISGSIQTSPTSGLTNALISAFIGKKANLSRGAAVAVASLVSTESSLLNELSRLTSKNVEDHIGRTGVDEDTGWKETVTNFKKEKKP